MKTIFNAVDKYRDLIIDAEKYIWQNPETGYFEYKTNAYMIKAFEDMGYDLVKAEGITGFYTVVDTGRKGPTVLVLAELDALLCASHPDADKQTGAVHCCGHNAQCAAMLGIAGALKEKSVLDKLCGKIKLCLVPAEEGVEIGKRKELIKKGVISFSSGKPEFIKRRYFDDVDVSFMVHTHSASGSERFCVGTGSNGVIRKSTVFKGKSAHAGGAPHEGINALNTASTAITTINSLRETFKEEDKVRVHSIITKGGDAVNAVPDTVIMESYVRGASVKALKDANDKVNRTITAVAAAFGANVEIYDMAGSEALNDDKNLSALAKEVMVEMCGSDKVLQREFLSSSTDMGDISTLFPTVHAYACGATGVLHGKDFIIADPENACVDSAKFQVGLLLRLLENDAEKAKKIIKEYKPVFSSIDEYIKHKNSLNMNKETVIYNEDGTITLDYKG